MLFQKHNTMNFFIVFAFISTLNVTSGARIIGTMSSFGELDIPTIVGESVEIADKLYNAVIGEETWAKLILKVE